MDSKAFKNAVALLVAEKNISEDVIYEAMELALTSAYKKNYNSLSNVRVDINRDTGDIKVYSFKTVLPIDATDEEGNEIFDERVDLTLEEARKIVPGINYGETIEEEVTPKDFGRVAAATAKQVVVQKIREAERDAIIGEFASKENEMMSGIVAMEDARNYYIALDKAQGILPKSEIIPGETIKMGSNIKVYISKVESTSKGPLILLSRTHYGFVKRLFELEIPEINEGIILVYSNVPEKFIENALSPAKNVRVFITNPKKQEAMVIVDNDNLSLAIGKKGLNVRLASKLTHYKIDVKTYDQAKEEGINILE